jgi:phage shock protein C
MYNKQRAYAKIALFLYGNEGCHFRETYMEMEKKLRKSDDKMIAGVCAGIAEYFDIDPTWVRIGYALLTIFSIGLPGIIAYIAL